MRNLVIGYGEIGKAVGSVIGNHNWLDRHVEPPAKAYDILHVSFPYSENFVDIVKGYINQYKAEHVIIWSTVPIGTTKRIPGAVHSPVEGVHPVLVKSIKSMVRWIGVNNRGEGEFFENYFKRLLMRTKVVDSSDYTEALKLLSTTEYGVNIEFARYKKYVTDKIGMDFELTKTWNQDYNKLYHNLDIPWAKKYVLDAPEGPKGGHCVTPNAQLLQKQFPDELVKIVAEL